MSVSGIENVTAALVAARRNRQPADDAPLANALDTPDEAYEVQRRVAQALGWTGATARRFWKSGGPSRSALQTHAALPFAGVTGALQQACAGFFQRGIEAELALRLGRDVDAALAATLDSESAGALCDAMAVSVEIVESRWQSAGAAPMLLKLADQQSHGSLMLGPWGPFVPRDWSTVVCRVRQGERPEQTWQGSHTMVDPRHVLPKWLVFATRDGQVLPAGTVVTTGTWCGLVDGHAGEPVTVTFDGIGAVSFRFAA